MATLYGVAEIAAALDVSPNLVTKWRQRGRLPEPDAVLATGPVWTQRRIGPFIEAQRRREAAVRRAQDEVAS